MSDAPPAALPIALLYVGDPMCSWCWGFTPELRRLSSDHALGVDVLVGGLRPGPNAEPLDERMRRYLEREWSRIEEVTGQPFDHSALDREGWVYDTELPARAVVTARELEPGLTLDVFERLQRAFYAEAQDITDPAVCARLAAEAGLEEEAFSPLLNSDASRKAAWQDFSNARRLGANGFPTLFVRVENRAFLVSRGYQPADAISPLVERVREEAGDRLGG